MKVGSIMSYHTYPLWYEWPVQPGRSNGTTKFARLDVSVGWKLLYL